MPEQGWAIVDESKPAGWTPVASARVPHTATDVLPPPGPRAGADDPVLAFHQTGAYPTEPWTDEQWRALTPAERVQNIMYWSGKKLMGTFMGPGGAEAVDHPAATLISAAVPIAAQGLAKAVPPSLLAKGAALVAKKGATTALRSVGVPGPIAHAAVNAASRYAGKAVTNLASGSENAAASEQMIAGMGGGSPNIAPVVAEAAPVAAAAPPQAATVAPKAAMSPAMIRNAVGLAAKRANANFSDAELELVDELVKHGLNPVQAVMQIKNASRGVNAAAALAKRLGTMSEDQMNAEIAARVGNRSPRR